MRLFLRLWVPVLFVGWLIYYFSSIPSLSTGWGIYDLILRKMAHVVEFGVFAFLLFRAVSQTWTDMPDGRVVLICITGGILYAISDEFHQSFVPGRGPSVIDVLIDSIGVLMAMLMYKSKWRQPLFKTFLWSFVVLSVVGCGPQGEFNRARKLEQKGKYYKAWQKFQVFAADNPTHSLAPEALFRAGWLVQMKLNDCHMAHTFFDRVMERYPQSTPWAKMAGTQKDNCPDYFPLLPGSRWVEGDSDTKGEIARNEIACKPIEKENQGFPSEKGILVNTYFAGEKKVQTNRFVYKKKEGQLREFKSESDPRYKTIFSWPVRVGQKWSTKSDKKLYRYEILADNLEVKVAAGDFENCVKVRSFVEGAGSSATNEYYAPGVGRVLKTVSTRKGETRVTELISFTMAPWPDLTVSTEEKK